jgi:cbb3-type cytochrome oxidase subunit 3
VRFCDPTLAGTRGISSATTAYPSIKLCGVARNNTNVTLTASFLQSDTRWTRVTVIGALFDYDAANSVACHYSNYNDPWTPESSGVPATFVSACEVVCNIPPQPYPTRAAGGMAVAPSDPAAPGGGGLAVVPTSSLPNPVGNLRVRQTGVSGEAIGAAPWSNPLEVDAIGSGWRLVSDWDSKIYPRRAVTKLEPIAVTVVDILGSSLYGLDPDARAVDMYSPTRAQRQLNASSPTAALASTCQPTPGFATFSNLVLNQPETGDYALYFDGSGLRAELAEILHIRSTDVTLNHYLVLLNVLVPYTTPSLDSTDDGLLPVQPMIGIYRAGDGELDGNVSDIPCLAVVLPEDPQEFADPSRGLNLTRADPVYGNSVNFELGEANFEALRFIGLPGKRYRIIFQMLNSSVAVEPVNVTVYSPDCPLKVFGASVAVVQYGSPPNSSLIISDGVLVKGWKFRTPVTEAEWFAYTCQIVNAVLPARFVDPCTIECFVPWMSTNPQQVSSRVTLCNASDIAASTSAPTCCYDPALRQSRCTGPLTANLTVTTLMLNATAGATFAGDSAPTDSVALGNFTAIGPAAAIRVAPNSQSPFTILVDQQAVLSDQATSLASTIIEFIDSEQNHVGRTDEGNYRPVEIINVTKRDVTVLAVPANFTTVQTRLGGSYVPATDDSSCFASELLQQAVRLTGPRRGIAVGGGFSFDNLKLRLPLAGTYNITIATYQPLNGSAAAAYDADRTAFMAAAQRDSSNASLWNIAAVQYTATATVHVLPGRPTRACLYTDYYNVRVQNRVQIDPQPVLMLLDDASNLYQPLRRERRLDAVADLYSFDAFVATISFDALLLARPYNYREGRGTGPWYVESVALTKEGEADSVPPAADYADDGTTALTLFAYKQLSVVRTAFDFEYKLQFRSPQLSTTPAPTARLVLANASAADAVSPAMLVKNCGNGEYGVGGSDTCLPCPSGLSHCLGGPNSRCFLCNGSTGMNVTDGYWRYSALSTVAYHCSTGGECLGNTELGTCGGKYLNHQPLCAVCQEGNARDLLGTCVECSPTWVSVIVLLLIGCVIVFVLALFVLVTLRDDGNDDTDQSLVLLLKIFVNFVQVVGMLGEFEVNFPSYVAGYFDIVAAGSGGSGISISPVNCLFPNLTYLDKMIVQLVAPPVLLLFVVMALLWSGYRKRRQEEREAAAYGFILTDQEPGDDDNNVTPEPGASGAASPAGETPPPEMTPDEARRVTPPTQSPSPEGAGGLGTSAKKQHKRQRSAAAVAPAGGGGGAVRVLRKRKRQRKLFNWPLFTTIAVIFLFIIYQTIVTQCIDAFRCEELSTGSSGTPPLKILRRDARIDCNSLVYQRHVSAAMYGLFFYGAALPLGGMTLVLRTALKDGWFVANGTFAFLIRGFRLRFWFWEFVIVFRKVLIRVLLSAVEDATLQALLGIWSLTGLFLIHAYTRPYVRSLHNHAESLGLMTLVVTLNIGLLFRSAELSSGDVCGGTCSFVMVVLVLFNVGVILFFLFYIGRAGIDRVVEMFGVDRADGERTVSLRHAKRRILEILQQSKRLAPSFIDYIPPFENRELAVSVLGYEAIEELDDAVAAAEEKAARKKVRKYDEEYVVLNREDGKADRRGRRGRGNDDEEEDDDDNGEQDATNKRRSNRKRRAKLGDDDDDDGAARGARFDDDESSSEESTDVDAVVDALFDVDDVPAAEGPVALPRSEAEEKAGADHGHTIAPPRRKNRDFTMRRLVGDTAGVAQDVIDAAAEARDRATEAATGAAKAMSSAAMQASRDAADGVKDAAVSARDMANAAASASLEAANAARDRVAESTRDARLVLSSFADSFSSPRQLSGGNREDSAVGPGDNDDNGDGGEQRTDDATNPTQRADGDAATDADAAATAVPAAGDEDGGAPQPSPAPVGLTETELDEAVDLVEDRIAARRHEAGEDDSEDEAQRDVVAQFLGRLASAGFPTT